MANFKRTLEYKDLSDDMCAAAKKQQQVFSDLQGIMENVDSGLNENMKVKMNGALVEMKRNLINNWDLLKNFESLIDFEIVQMEKELILKLKAELERIEECVCDPDLDKTELIEQMDQMSKDFDDLKEHVEFHVGKEDFFG